MKKVLTKEQNDFLCMLVLCYGDALTKYAYRFYGYQPHMFETAQDAVQETFLKAVHDVDILMAHPNKIGWLKVSLRNILFNLQRDKHWKFERQQNFIKGSPERRLQNVLDAFDTLDRYPKLKDVITVANAILTEDEVDTFYDHFLVGLTTEETAILENTSSDTVRGRISRIRKKLRKHFGMSCCFLVILFYR